MTGLPESLRMLARGPAVDPADAQVLNDAANALEAGTATTDLLTVDWTELLADVDRQGQGSTRLANIVEGFRDGGFVAPIVLLWIDLRSAVDAYDGAADAPFFSQWQDGFGHQTRTFGSTAIIVLAILMILAVLSMGLIVLRGRVARLSREAELRNRRLARQVTLGLSTLAPTGDKAVQQAAQAARQLTEPVANLAGAADRIVACVDPLVSVVSTQAADVALLKASTQDMVQTVGRLETVASEVQRQAAATLSSVGVATASASDTVALAVGSAQRLEAVLSSGVDLAHSLDKAARGLESSTAELTAIAETASRMFANLRMQIAELEQL